MARSSGSSRLLVALSAGALMVAMVRMANMAFLPAGPLRSQGAPVPVGASAVLAALGAAAPALAEEAAATAAEAAAPAAEAAAPAAEPAVAAVAPAAEAAVAAAPAAEGGLLNFGKVPLGGGFAINLDIPETGIVNIVVLIAGLIYLLGPLLSESMASREKEIQTDIDDAIAKWNESVERLAEAEKNQAQAAAVIAEIDASIEKDKSEFKATVESQLKTTLARREEASEANLKNMKEDAKIKVERFIAEQAVQRGLKELKNLSDDKKKQFLDVVIDAL